MNKGFDKETFKRSVVDNVKNMFRRTIDEATPQQVFQRLLCGLRGGLLLLVGVEAHVILGHGVEEIQLLGDLAQDLAAGLQVGAEQFLVNGGVDGLVDPGLRRSQECVRAQAADILCVDGPQLERVKDGRGRR